MGFKSLMTKTNLFTKRHLGSVGRPAAVAGATYAALDRGLPAAAMMARGNPVILSTPVKAGAAVGTAAIVEGAFYLSRDSETMQEEGHRLASSFMEEVEALQEKEKKAAAKEKKAAEKKAAEKKAAEKKAAAS
jgi:hypothetical protein